MIIYLYIAYFINEILHTMMTCQFIVWLIRIYKLLEYCIPSIQKISIGKLKIYYFRK